MHTNNYYQRANENLKKILCKNIINEGKCIYGAKCLYAHSLDDQNIDRNREIAYQMIKKDDELSHINLSKNDKLYNSLITLSKLCEKCEKGECTGGYNCKYGACKSTFVVCLVDLNKGTCNEKCNKVHLTGKKLIPYGISLINEKSVNTPVSEETTKFFEEMLNVNDSYEAIDELEEIIRKNDRGKLTQSIFSTSH
jgi:hypothetical protein